MEQFLYAQLDENSVCTCLSQLSGVVDAPHMIRLTEEEFNMDLLGRVYKEGVWKDNEVDGHD